MKMERLLPILLMPNIAMAKGGGGIVLGIIFLPLLIWAFIKIWTFWFRLIFRGPNQGATQQQAASHLISQPTRECPYCAELILVKAKKCKHCGSDVS